MSGAVPLWSGPEGRGWSAEGWSATELDLLLKLSQQATGPYLPMATQRCFLKNGKRDVRYSLFWAEQHAMVIGLAHFGAETEGFPRKVHNACSSGVAEVAMLGCAGRAMDTAFGSCTQLTAQYRKFIPVGATVLVEAQCTELAGTRVKVACKLRDPATPSTVYWEGVGSFVGLRGKEAPPAGPPPDTAKGRWWWPFS
eukprot:EG_transcript_24906